MILRITSLLTVLFASVSLQAQSDEKPNAIERLTQVKFYIDKVQPILINNCYACHGPGSGVRKSVLSNRKDILSHENSGAAAIPGKADESLLSRP